MYYILSILLTLVSLTAAVGTPYKDSQTGYTFVSYDVSYKIGKTMTYRIAVPASASSSAGYDAVVQIVAPNEVGWAGLAWAGTMLYSPLTVAWKSGNTAVVSGRWATAYQTPSVDSRFSFTIIPTGTTSNGTHWQYTAKCTGCTSFTGRSGVTTLNPKGSNKVAYAWSPTRPTGTTASSTINVHDGAPSSFSLDFNLGANTNWT
ncbi:hypothetical protein BDV96DRAFT_498852 [Lophiotrema nucula]|uniref:Cellobiose dehydrogenase-like cytochrome domain-containing protein n=1 Tax=Lophiotrema nucula TaxID=690887 RepID=A0A6A5YXC7_9PLEO|nr:hypothetical protein BDV96DRAFT_498852 [Lophiotrema nucula]